MAIVKSKLLKQLSNSYPNFLKKDLEKFTNIILNEIKRALRKGDGVELRNFGTFRLKTQKASIRRNPKTGEKVAVPEKKVIRFVRSYNSPINGVIDIKEWRELIPLLNSF